MTRARLWLIAQLAGTGILLVVLLANFDWSLLAQSLARVSVWFYAWSFALLMVGQALYVYKWRVILRSLGLVVGFRRLFEQHLISMFFGNFLPTSIGGDVAKVYYLGQRDGYVAVGVSVVLDRGLGFVSIAAL